jgi:hydrogenase maturation protease
MTPKTLFIAYGNPDRQDDGVAWILLQRLAAHFGVTVDDPNADYYETLGKNPDFFFVLQLIPELADLIVEYDRVCFIDAHVGDLEGEIAMQVLSPHYEPSTLSHHMTPQFLLDIAETTSHRHPQALLISIRGYLFGFIQGLSEQTTSLAEEAFKKLVEWFDQA